MLITMCLGYHFKHQLACQTSIKIISAVKTGLGGHRSFLHCQNKKFCSLAKFEKKLSDVSVFWHDLKIISLQILVICMSLMYEDTSITMYGHFTVVLTTSRQGNKQQTSKLGTHSPSQSTWAVQMAGQYFWAAFLSVSLKYADQVSSMSSRVTSR